MALYLAALGVIRCASAPLRPATDPPPGAVLQDADQVSTSLAEAIDTHLEKARAEIAIARKMEREANRRSDGMWARAVHASAFMGGLHPELVAMEGAWTTHPESALATALTQLSAIAPVREEARGLVTAMDGRELFITGTCALMSEAKEALQQVAGTLIAQSEGQPILIEGYCSSQGSESTSPQPSLDRANAVRDYLVGRGVPSERIRALGLNLPSVGSYTEESASDRCWVEIVILSSAVDQR
jgi:outer membrane protein OmpA-like peptidoglycan-associated protein